MRSSNSASSLCIRSHVNWAAAEKRNIRHPVLVLITVQELVHQSRMHWTFTDLEVRHQGCHDTIRLQETLIQSVWTKHQLSEANFNGKRTTVAQTQSCTSSIASDSYVAIGRYNVNIAADWSITQSRLPSFASVKARWVSAQQVKHDFLSTWTPVLQQLTVSYRILQAIWCTRIQAVLSKILSI